MEHDIKHPAPYNNVEKVLINMQTDILFPDARIPVPVLVEELNRLGRSGAKVFLTFFDHEGKSIPYVFKTSQKEDIKAEFEAMKSIAQLVDDVSFKTKPVYCRKLGGILYPYRAGITKVDSPIDFPDFEKIAIDTYNDKYSINDSIKIINQVFIKMKNAHNVKKRQEKSILKLYSRYLRRHRSREIIKLIFGSKGDSEQFNFLGKNIYNPLYLINQLSDRRFNLWIGFVHGDLHPRNIVLFEGRVPYLIDFAWACAEQHILVDFVLLENSLRFLLFPRIYNFKEQAEVDESLLEETGYDNIKNIHFSAGIKRRLYSKLAKMIAAIRIEAKDYFENNFNEYLIAQFLVLYGLLRYDDYATALNIRALGLIAKRLHDNRVI